MIHAGTSQEESRAQIQEAADRLGIAHEKKIVWNQTDPAEAVMSAAAKEKIDLLIVGAYEGPSLGKRRFIGPVAQTLALRAQCSLLLVAHPRLEEHRFKRVVAEAGSRFQQDARNGIRNVQGRDWLNGPEWIACWPPPGHVRARRHPATRPARSWRTKAL